MSQQRYLQQLRSNIQLTKEAAIRAINSQLGKANDGSFILGRYSDGTNGIRTIIGVKAYVEGVASTISIYELDGIEFGKLQDRLHTIEHTVGIGEGSDGTASIAERVKEIEDILTDLNASVTTINSIDNRIYNSELSLIGDKIADTEESSTIEGAKKYADKAIEKALESSGVIEKAISEASAAATTKFTIGQDNNDMLSITPIVNSDNSTTYEVSLGDIATQVELDEVKEFLGMTDGGEGTVTIIERIEAVDDRVTEEVTKLDEKIAKNKEALTVLNGTGEGSVHMTVSTAISELINGADTAYDTLKEISDYIASDKTGAAQMNNSISDLQKTVNALGKVNVIACDGSDLIRVSTSVTLNGDSKEEKTFTVCANNIASLTDVNNAKSELNNKIGLVEAALEKEKINRQTADSALDTKFSGEVARLDGKIDTVDSKVTIMLGTGETSIDGRIDAAVKSLKGDATTSGNNLGLLEDRIETLERDVNMEGGHVDTLVKTSIQALDYNDTPKVNEFVKAVHQTDGTIRVEREQFANAMVTSDGKLMSEVLTEIYNNIGDVETSAKAAASKVTVSGNDILTKTETVDPTDGSTTYDINLGNTWDCGEFTYTEEQPQ